MIMMLLGNINAIPFRRRFGGGGGTPFPNIPGMIARWSAKGLTNEDMSTNPVWKDLMGNGYDLQMKNFSWAGMSGVGGYNQNFNGWRYGNLTGIGGTQTHTSSKINLNIPSTVKNTNIYSNATSVAKEGDIYDFTLKVMGLKDGALLRVTKGGFGEDIERIEKDGIYKIYQPFEAGWDQSRIYIWISNPKAIDLNIIIEQLPSYPGFILGDGVDDFAVTEKELNFEDTYTVYTAFIPFQDDPVRNMILCGKNETKDFSINYSGTHINFKPSKGVNLAPHINQFMLLVCKRNKDITTIINLSTGESNSLSSEEFIANPGLYYLWRNVYATFLARAAIAGQTICNGYFSTDEDDEKVLNYYKQEYPWLFPDQAWTVVGKTNEDTDRATIANITGNGNNLVLSNFGFIEGSGYNEEGKYAGYLVTDGVDDKIMSSLSFKFHDNWSIVGDWGFIENKTIACGLRKINQIYIYNVVDGSSVYLKQGSVGKFIPTKFINYIDCKGVIYDKNYNQYQISPGGNVDIDSVLNLGWFGSGFTKLAFKNLAIYSEVLSKEDCIKAYNYLQTLKAK